jgi:hypothetical protein
VTFQFHLCIQKSLHVIDIPFNFRRKSYRSTIVSKWKNCAVSIYHSQKKCCIICRLYMTCSSSDWRIGLISINKLITYNKTCEETNEWLMAELSRKTFVSQKHSSQHVNCTCTPFEETLLWSCCILSNSYLFRLSPSKACKRLKNRYSSNITRIHKICCKLCRSIAYRSHRTIVT